MTGFSIRLTFRIILLAANLAFTIWLWVTGNLIILACSLSIVAVLQVFEIHYFINLTNRKLANFLESVKYSDFISGFSSGNKLGKSFRELNTSINEVMEAFRKARTEKEEHHQYLHTVVEHVGTGLLSFDHQGNIGLINAAAKRLIGRKNIRNIEELIEEDSRLYKAIFDLPPGKGTLFAHRENAQLALSATEIKMRGNHYKLVAFHNIQTELQKKEVDAWQNLTRVLRHEIMNSIAPISSLTSTLKDILREDLVKEKQRYVLNPDTVEDLREGLNTIGSRSNGLISFIEAYRDYTGIPSPDIREVPISELFNHVIKLLKAGLEKEDIDIKVSVDPGNLSIKADKELIGQVLINLLKNALEALKGRSDKNIILLGCKDETGVVLKVRDNGPGIVREAYDKIFIPFYSTKSKGSGIGLALSRQILQLHHGTISVNSKLGEFTEFTLRF